ncbi:hypothetical protein GCM10008018_61750 [Paenibacillus marchantiophytorum]|uniref:Serine protease n=1 Tax=Paenibacillus marchantiophytorum TaxID=1619310 RepID=A0ABQ1FF46_9BACL|nr:S1 family peptidase [Paenibacillus marchantiophytorum]GGA07617.1 hypothetical protein GCM10008018_61750 [Paenibacillus marchantiophytorum]
MKKLDELHDLILKRKEELAKLGVSINSINTNTYTNRVEIGVDSKKNNVEKTLLDMFGEAVVVIEEKVEPTRTTYNGYLESGLHIVKNSSSYCTSNIAVRDSSFNYYLVTAGHCLWGGSSSWTQGSQYIGYGATWNTGYADVGTIKISSSDATKYVYLSSTQANYFTDVQPVNTNTVGDYVCQSSATSGYVCGYVTSINASVTFDGYTFTKQVRANYTVNGGDSGGPVFTWRTIKGIQSAKMNASGEAVFSQMGYALQNIGNPTPILN